MNIWRSYKQERDCLVDFARLANSVLKDGESTRDNQDLTELWSGGCGPVILAHLVSVANKLDRRRRRRRLLLTIAIDFPWRNFLCPGGK